MNNVTTMLAGGGILGLLAGFWKYIQIYASKFLGLFIVRIRISNFDGVNAFKVLLKDFKSSPLTKKRYSAESLYVKPLKKHELVGLSDLPSEPTVMWRNRKPLIVTLDSGRSEGATYGIDICFIRGVYKADDLVLEAVDKYNEVYSPKCFSGKKWRNSYNNFCMPR